MIGDSYITGAASPALQPALVALISGASSYRNYAMPGAALATGGLSLIPPQFNAVLNASPPGADLVILDGGFMDIFVCDTSSFLQCDTLCKQSGSSTTTVCTDIVSAARTAFNDLLAKMADNGVADVIYFSVPHVTAASGGYSEIIDYSVPLFANDCAAALTNTGGQLACHFIDMRDVYAAAGGDLNPANFAGDGIHPSDAGQKAQAQAIADVLGDQCLGQPQSSGCCRP